MTLSLCPASQQPDDVEAALSFQLHIWCLGYWAGRWDSWCPPGGGQPALGEELACTPLDVGAVVGALVVHTCLWVEWGGGRQMQ